MELPLWSGVVHGKGRIGHEAGALGREGDGGFQVRNNVRADTAPAGRFGCYRPNSAIGRSVW